MVCCFQILIVHSNFQRLLFICYILQDIFLSLSTVDDLYFMCSTQDFQFLAKMIQHIPLSLRARYVLCCAPINHKMTFVCAMFTKVRTIHISFSFHLHFNCYVSLLVCNKIQQIRAHHIRICRCKLWISVEYAKESGRINSLGMCV